MIASLESILDLIAPIRPLQLRADGGYQLRFRSLEGTPNYGPRQYVWWFLFLNAFAIRSVGVAIWPRLLLGEDWASGEPKVCPLLEGVLGRDIDPPGSAALARGWARARRDRVLEWTEPRLNRTHQAFAALC